MFGIDRLLLELSDIVIRSLVQRMIRLYPFYSGAGTVAHGRIPKSLTARPELVVTRLNDGSSILVYAHDPLGRTVFYTGDYDPRVTWVLRRLLRPGDCFLDIGANMGVLSLIGARLVGATGCVHAFEPQPSLARNLAVSADLNDYSWLHVHEVALSDSDGAAEFHVSDEATVFGSLEQDCGPNNRSIRVQVRRAESFLHELQLPSIRLLKIDVERHEEAVFRGAGDYLAKNTPAAIIFESQSDGTPFLERGTVRQIQRLGYDFFRIPKPMVRMGLVPVSANGQGGHEPAGGGPHGEDGYDFVALSLDPRHRDARAALGVRT